jgi:hypothetical protein
MQWQVMFQAVAQHIIITFFSNKGEKMADIHHHYQLQFAEECLSHSSVLQWCQLFKDSHEHELNMVHAARPTTAVKQVNIQSR